MRDIVFDRISKERDRQDDMYGSKNAKLGPLAHKWLTLHMEELGEAAETLDYIDCEEDDYEREQLINHYKVELTQLAALVVQHLEVLERNG